MILLTLGLKQLAVPDFIVPHCMLEDQDFQCLLGVIVGEFAIVNKGSDTGIKGRDASNGLLVHIQEEPISEVLEVVFGLDGSCNGI